MSGVPIVKRSRYAFAETVERIVASIRASGATVFATIDQSAAARDAGTSLRPTTLVIFGNPKTGTPLMEAYPTIALELPLKILVWDDAGAVSVAVTSMSDGARRYGIAQLEPFSAMDGLLARLLAQVDANGGEGTV